MKNINRWLVLLAAVCLLLTGAKATLAQTGTEPTGFKNVQLWINPEYDDPRLLVMLEGQIVGVTAPAEVRFLVPTAAEMYSAGSMDAQGQYSGGPPPRAPSGLPGWDEISYEVQSDTFRVEYYDPIIAGQPDKTIAYDFRWLYPIADLEVIVQQPRLASNFSVSPPGTASTDGEGFTVYVYQYTGLDDQPPLHFDISYTKSDARPSLAIGNNKASSNPLLVVVIIIVLGMAIVGGFFWVRRPRPMTRAARRRLASQPAAGGSKRPPPQRRFCRQCGNRLEDGYGYCPYCGTKL
ncbi:MAG: zinc ribbon domain-containing protein [Chloroflexota bacterium]